MHLHRLEERDRLDLESFVVEMTADKVRPRCVPDFLDPSARQNGSNRSEKCTAVCIRSANSQRDVTQNDVL